MKQYKKPCSNGTEINPQLYGQMIFDRGTKTKERTIFSTNSVRKTKYSYVKRMKLDPYLIP